MGLVILDRSPKLNIFSLEYLKNIGRSIFKKTRGPQAVTTGLLFGLNELRYGYKYNPKEKKIDFDDIVYVNGSIRALKWAIKAKRDGKIRNLIAGPVMTVLPDDKSGIMLDKNIDRILFPSQWTKDFWLSLAPWLGEKIQIWPAGVSDPGMVKNRKNSSFIIYQKNAPVALLSHIINYFETKNINYKIIKYGSYKKSFYLKMLENSTGMVYLSESESQGLALCEAWMYNIPTIVWNRGYWEYGKYKWFDTKISAPYLTEECGRFFAGKDDFIEKWHDFENNLNVYKPRTYAVDHFSNKVSANIFVDLLKIC
ncbi:MAG: hypothetical protein WCT40_01465 [Candidatus Magasanikbacteria bacterium]|jgi:hypothetical protein